MPNIDAIQNSDGYWNPTIDGAVLHSSIAEKGFPRRETALQIAQGVISRGESVESYNRPIPKFSFPEGEKVEFRLPDPSPEPDYSCMGEAGARPKKVDVNLFHQADPIPNTLPYEKPDVFDQSTSKGSSPIICCPNDEIDLSPAEVTSIKLVRLIEAQRIQKMLASYSKVDVNLDPEADGYHAAELGRQRKSCPWTKTHNPVEAKLWLDAFDSFNGVRL